MRDQYDRDHIQHAKLLAKQKSEQDSKSKYESARAEIYAKLGIQSNRYIQQVNSKEQA